MCSLKGNTNAATVLLLFTVKEYNDKKSRQQHIFFVALTYNKLIRLKKN